MIRLSAWVSLAAGALLIGPEYIAPSVVAAASGVPPLLLPPLPLSPLPPCPLPWLTLLLLICVCGVSYVYVCLWCVNVGPFSMCVGLSMYSGQYM